MDGIRVARAGLLIGWVLVSMLVVAGFAAFSAEEDAPEAGATTAASVGDLGRNAGAVSALGFAARAVGTGSTVTTLDLDPEAAPLAGRTPDTAPATTTPDRASGSGAVFNRSGYLEETEVRALVSSFFAPEDVNKAIRVAWCESSFNPAAVNPATGASGLFQHLPEEWAERSAAAGFPGASIFDPEANVGVAAWLLYESPGGWSHWECSP